MVMMMTTMMMIIYPVDAAALCTVCQPLYPRTGVTAGGGRSGVSAGSQAATESRWVGAPQRALYAHISESGRSTQDCALLISTVILINIFF
ncbi:hypothetical protein ACOMHN_028572 [Nucella lapillus]